MGLTQMLVMDNDYLDAGNLVRHLLTMSDISLPKAKALANRLNIASPHAAIKCIATKFPPTDEESRSVLNDYEIIVDCTGKDELLHSIQEFKWLGNKLFVSLSLGMHARRMFCFSMYSHTFSYQAFDQLITPWLVRESKDYEGEDLPITGIGCWHPLFPARLDDVWTMASIATKYLEAASAIPPDMPRLSVYQRHDDNDGAMDIERTDESID
jgi:hypothetical protein